MISSAILWVALSTISQSNDTAAAKAAEERAFAAIEEERWCDAAHAFMDANDLSPTVDLIYNAAQAADYAEEFDYTPGRALSYRGLTVRLEHVGDVVEGSFRVERVPAYLAVDRLMKRTAVRESTRNSGVITVSVTDTDPFRAAETANALCNNYLDELAEGGAEWRRWEFVATGSDSYSERLYRQVETGWELLTEFEFVRTTPGG